MNTNPIYLSDHGKMLADLFVQYCVKTTGATKVASVDDVILTLNTDDGPKREHVLKTLMKNGYLEYHYDEKQKEYRVVLTENGFHLGGSLASARHRY